MKLRISQLVYIMIATNVQRLYGQATRGASENNNNNNTNNNFLTEDEV